MFFLATLLFVAVLYVVPGFLLLDLGARFAAFPWVPMAVVYWALALLVYLTSLTIVYLGRYAYHELQMERGPLHIRPYLDARACRWLTLVGIGFIGWQFQQMSARWAMPYQFAPLYGALLIGLLDLRRRPVSLQLKEDLPGPRFEADPSPPDLDGEGVTLSWEYLAAGNSTEAHVFELSMPLDREHYERAVNELAFTPKQPADYVRCVTQGPMDDVRLLAAWIRRQSCERGYSPLQETENVIQMVRSMPYLPDSESSGDQPKYPIQTLVDQGGDCEDHAILAAALLWQLGHPVGLAHLELHGRAHMALAYATDTFEGSFSLSGPDGRSYAYIETVPSSADMGEIPEEFLRELRRATIVPV